jgi:hypothetical protein
MVSVRDSRLPVPKQLVDGVSFLHIWLLGEGAGLTADGGELSAKNAVLDGIKTLHSDAEAAGILDAAFHPGL